MNTFYFAVLGICCLALGRSIYLFRWPDRLWPAEPDQDLERIRRIGRRRVLPLPNGGAHPRGRDGHDAGDRP